MSEKAWLSKKLNNDKILCQACAHACKLDEGEYGICGVRRVEDGELKLLVYGLVAAVNVDPIEKKPLYHFLPKSRVFSLGTVGCNLSCSFCQNYDISQYPKDGNHQIRGRQLLPEDIVRLAIDNECKSIAYTYNEPVIFFEYTYDTAKLAHTRGVKNVYVTSGYETHKSIDLIAPYLDAMNIDIKSFSDVFYREICGARLKPVLETIKYAHQKGIWIELTTLLITGKNDSNEEIQSIAKFIAQLDTAIPWHLSAFHPTYKMIDRPSTALSTLLRAYKIAKEEGLKYVYIGNVSYGEYQSTYCQNCEKNMIERGGTSIVNRVDEKGVCPYCSTLVDGVWR